MTTLDRVNNFDVMNSWHMTEMWQKYRLYLCGLFVLVVLSPVLINLYPLHYFSPDLQYVQAKLLYVMDGNLYDDPVTGYPNMHPPIYHLFLALPTMIGIPIDTSLFLISISNLLLIFFFIFKIIRKLFDTDTAVIICFLFPFINEYMGCGYPFLATALNFSIPFYLAGTYIYLTGKRSARATILLSSLWGLAFLITPVYIFPIGFTLLYELLFRRNTRFFSISSVTLAIVLIPFFYQAYVVSSNKLFETTAFSFWHGWPDLNFLQQLGAKTITPTAHELTDPLIWAIPLVATLGLIGAWRMRRDIDFATPAGYLTILLFSYLFTSYHFSPQYATRIYLFLSLFLTAFALTFLVRIGTKAIIRVSLIVLLMVFGTHSLLSQAYNIYESQGGSAMENFKEHRPPFAKALDRLVPQGNFVLAGSRTYRLYILPYHLVHGLRAYESGAYYQLSSKLSSEFQKDYEMALLCKDGDCLNSVCDKYGIEYAVVHAGDFRFPVFQYIDKNWDRMYVDLYFAIFERKQSF